MSPSEQPVLREIEAGEVFRVAHRLVVESVVKVAIRDDAAAVDGCPVERLHPAPGSNPSRRSVGIAVRGAVGLVPSQSRAPVAARPRAACHARSARACSIRAILDTCARTSGEASGGVASAARAW